MDKQQLANGQVTVWQDGNETVIHHANGLTISLTAEEARALRAWLETQDAAWEERAEFENRQRLEREFGKIVTIPVARGVDEDGVPEDG
jgi:hypothetical protein